MIYVFLADGFEETEAIASIDILRRAELDVLTVGVNGKVVTGSHNITVVSDIEMCDVDLSIVSAIVLPGGMPGTLNLEKSQGVQDCIDYCYENNILIGAICAAPSILGKKEMLKGKKATCFQGFECFLIGANYTHGKVEKDGFIITAKSAGHTINFALEMVNMLKGEFIARKIKAAIQ